MNHQGDDAGTLVWSIDTYKDETSTFPPSVMGLMSGKGPEEMAAITSTGDAQVDLPQSKEHSNLSSKETYRINYGRNRVSSQ